MLHLLLSAPLAAITSRIRNVVHLRPDRGHTLLAVNPQVKFLPKVVGGDSGEVTMKTFPWAIVLIAFMQAVASAPAQEVEPASHGFWVLKVEESDFRNRPKPKMGFMNWGEHGWASAMVMADGQLYTEAVSTDVGCTLIGVFNSYSCQVEVITPRQIRFTVRRGPTVRRVGDIELLKDGKAQMTYRVMPPNGTPYVETTIWERQDRR